MPKFTKVLSVIIHKRSLLDNIFIIIFPKIFFKKKLDKYTFIQKYVLKNVCLTTLNFNYNNLVYLSYINKIDFLNVFYKDFAKASIVKCNNLFFNFFFFNKYKNVFFLSLNAFSFKIINYIQYFYKYIYIYIIYFTTK